MIQSVNQQDHLGGNLSEGNIFPPRKCVKLLFRKSPSSLFSSFVDIKEWKRKKEWLCWVPTRCECGEWSEWWRLRREGIIQLFLDKRKQGSTKAKMQFDLQINAAVEQLQRDFTNANIEVVKVYLLYLNYKLIIFVDLSFSKLLF